MTRDILIIIAGVLAATIMVRAICVIYHAYYKTHKRGKLHFAGFGYSYIALGAAAATALAYVVTGHFAYVQWAVWLFLAASAGMILFDRRPRR